MVKNIVFCADGTWQSPTGGPASNVLKLFNILHGNLTVGLCTDPEQERTDTDLTDLAARQILQIAKYIDGVGAGSNWLMKLAGGSVGLGLVARVLRGYTFISRNYKRGDRIFLVGFSRGAYTARALGGLICAKGLLNWDGLKLNNNPPDDRGYQYAAAAWYQFQQASLTNRQSPDWLSRMQQIMSEAPDFAATLQYSPEYISDVTIQAIGVWDTVGALGIPAISDDHGARLDILRFADTKLHPSVKHGFHAIAADEQRIDFSPTLWDADPDRVTQCFFPGSHADVGGGFPLGNESDLSNLALRWMVEQLCGQGLRANINGLPTGSALGPEHLPWTELPYSVRPTGPREFPPYTGSGTPIATCDILRQRFAQNIPMMVSSALPITRTAHYVPVALAHAGYVDFGTAAMEP